MNLGDATEMVVMWVSWKNHTLIACKYGKSSGTYDDLTLNGTCHSYDEGNCILPDSCGWNGFIYTVKLHDLNPSTKYYYRVGNEEAWSAECFFTTAPSPSSPLPFTIAAFGDMGAFPGGGVDALETTKNLISHMNEFDLILDAGDLAYDYGYQVIWDILGRQIQPLASQIPFMTVVGNHENLFNFTAYINRFDMPNKQSGSESKFWYSFDFSYAHFVMISTEHDIGIGTSQYNWIKQDLKQAQQNRTNRPWIIMVGHKPIVCSNTYATCHESDVRETIEPLLHQYNVDLTIFGHVHAYGKVLHTINH